MKKLVFDHQLLVLVPEAWLKEVTEDLKFLRQHFNGKEGQQSLSGWISEADAMKLIGKKTTWFWKRRTSRELPFTKVGGKVYYAIADLNQYLERNKRSAA